MYTHVAGPKSGSFIGSAPNIIPLLPLLPATHQLMAWSPVSRNTSSPSANTSAERPSQRRTCISSPAPQGMQPWGLPAGRPSILSPGGPVEEAAARASGACALCVWCGVG